jgi:hypothetical protein
MPKVLLEGFECSRCGHRWFPRENAEPPTTCPKCKSPYWNRPRRSDVKPEHTVVCKWNASELDAKSVELQLAKAKKVEMIPGWFSAYDLGENLMQVLFRPMTGGDPIELYQEDVDTIETHLGKYRFSCSSRR